MVQFNPIKQLSRLGQQPITLGVLLCGLVFASLVYFFQDLGKSRNDSPPTSEWNAERVLNEFQRFMSVIEQHERVEGLILPDEEYMRAKALGPLGMELKRQFTILLDEVQKAVNFNNQYHAYVFSEMPEYPNVHQNLFNELRAVRTTIFSLTDSGSRYFARGSVYRDLDIRFKPFVRQLSLVLAYASQRQLDQERERNERILKQSRYVLIVTALFLLVGIGFLIVFVGRSRARRKITQLKLKELTDKITGLPTFEHLEQQFTEMLQGAKQGNSELYGIRIKVDRFQAINEIYNIATGDRLLRQIAIRLKGALPEKAILTRGQGNEFFLVEACERAQTAAELSVLVLQDVMRDSFPLELDDGEIVEGMSFTASAGIVLYPKDGSALGELLTKSQLALQFAAQQGNSYRYFDWRAARRTVSRDTIQLESDLRIAIQEDQFELYYQPQVDLETGRLSGTEALIRWRRLDRGESTDSHFVSPADFIPVAEDSGLIIPIGHWVIKEACHQAKLWQEEGYPPVTMSVNISVIQFRQQDLVERIQEVLDQTGLAAEWLELEVTESIVADDIQWISNVLGELKALGIRVAIDDFGTGYSSLSYLTRLPFDKLKIDQSFVRNTDRQSWAIVRAVVQLARSLELKIVAEGVETIESMHQLRDLGCHIGQGYYFSQPIPAPQFVEYIKEDLKKRPDNELTVKRNFLRVGLPTDYAQPYLNSRLAEFRQVHNDIQLRVRCDLSEQLVESLVLGELDTVVAIVREANEDRLSATWEIEPIWVTSLDFTLEHGEAVPLIVRPEGCEYRKRMVECLNTAERAWYVAYQSPELASLQDAVRNGLGVSALTRLTLDEKMKIMDVEQGFPALRNIKIGLYTANGGQLGNQSDILNNWLSESLARNRH